MKRLWEMFNTEEMYDVFGNKVKQKRMSAKEMADELNMDIDNDVIEESEIEDESDTILS